MTALAEATLTASGTIAELTAAASRDDAPQAAQVEAAVLIADVSGFTALTASLEASHGGRGADMLSTIMDRLLGSLAEIAEDRGGRVVDLIGDAIHVVWVAEGERDIDEARSRAADAASAMLDYAIATSGGEYRTPIRIGVASGSVDLAMVGGHDGRWELLAMGPAFARAAEACTRSPKNACLIGGGAAWREPAERAGGSADNEEWWLIERTPTAIPASIKKRAQGDALVWNAELRLVTVMFCGLIRAGEAVQVSVDRIHRLARIVQAVIADHGGMVDKIHADEKGVSAVVAFGMNVDAQPSGETGHNISGGSALHAVLAAIDLRRALRELGTEAAIGVATGKVRVGIGDGGHGSSHTLYGNAVNFAARCMQASRSEILCDEITRAAASSEVAFHAPETRAMKGLAEGSPVFAVAGVRDAQATAPADTTPIAGRAAERAAITRFVADSESTARLLILDGNHGSGKSRLASFAIEEAARQGQQTLLLRAGLLGTRTPLFAWREPMAMLLKARFRVSGLSRDNARAALCGAAGGTAGDWGQIAMLFGNQADVSDDEGEGDAATARTLRSGAAGALIGDGHWLIVIEDAHWLDDVSIQLARDLLRSVPALKLVLVSQSPVPPPLFKIGRDPLRVTLGDLDRAATGALAVQLLGDFDSKHPFIDWLHARSAGNPMFARALIEILPADIRTTALGAPGAWRKAQAALEAADMPATIEGALLARFGNLPARQLGLLKAASVTGGEFDPAFLRALSPTPEPEAMADDLRALVDAGILVRAEAGDRVAWRFADALTRDVVATSLPQQLSLELHRRAAEYLETRPGSNLAGGAAQIAHHWLEADAPERAIVPLRRAGVEAKQAGAYASAVSLWETALSLIDNGRAGARSGGKFRRAVLHRDLAFASWRLGEPEATIRHCYASLEGHWPGAPESDAGWRAMLAREALGLAARIASPKRIWSRGKRKAAARMSDWLRLSVAVRLIEAFYFSRGALPAAAVALYAARIAEHTGQQAYAARPYGFLGYLAGARGMNRLARFFFNRPRRDCMARRDWSSLAQSIHGETMHLLTLGDWREAVARGRFGRRLARKLSATADTGSLTTLMGLGRLMGGDFAGMRADFETVEAIAYAKANDHYLLFAREGIGQLELAMGAPDRALPLLIAAEELAERVRDLQSALIAQGLLANARLRLGQIAEVQEMSGALLARVETTPMVNFGTWYGFGAAAEALLGLYAALGPGPGDAHKQAATRCVATLDKFARRYRVAGPRAALCAGQLHALDGRPREAMRRWQRGIRLAEPLAMNHDLARLHDALARLAETPADDRIGHAAEAARLATLCGTPALPPLPLQISIQEERS